MKYPAWNSRPVRLGLAAVGALLITGAAFAGDVDDEVIVQSAPPALTNRSPFTAEQVVSITRSVSYSDLDLVTHAGVQTLEGRINDTATAICEKLDRLYATSGFDQFQCVRQAVRDAMSQARAAVAKAERKTRTAQVDTRG